MRSSRQLRWAQSLAGRRGRAFRARLRLHTKGYVCSGTVLKLRHVMQIILMPAPNAEPGSVVRQMSKAGFAIGTSQASSTRIDAERRNLSTILRIAPHYYNTEEEIERAVRQLVLV